VTNKKGTSSTQCTGLIAITEDFRERCAAIVGNRLRAKEFSSQNPRGGSIGPKEKNPLEGRASWPGGRTRRRSKVRSSISCKDQLGTSLTPTEGTNSGQGKKVSKRGRGRNCQTQTTKKGAKQGNVSLRKGGEVCRPPPRGGLFRRGSGWSRLKTNWGRKREDPPPRRRPKRQAVNPTKTFKRAVAYNSHQSIDHKG